MFIKILASARECIGASYARPLCLFPPGLASACYRFTEMPRSIASLHRTYTLCLHTRKRKGKGKVYFYSAHFCSTHKALRHGAHCNYTNACLYLVSVHQMAPPRLRLRTSTCSLLLIYRPRKDERLSRPGWLTYSGRFTHMSPVSYRSSAGQVSKVRRSKTNVLPKARSYRSYVLYFSNHTHILYFIIRVHNFGRKIQGLMTTTS